MNDNNLNEIKEKEIKSKENIEEQKNEKENIEIKSENIEKDKPQMNENLKKIVILKKKKMLKLL